MTSARVSGGQRPDSLRQRSSEGCGHQSAPVGTTAAALRHGFAPPASSRSHCSCFFVFVFVSPPPALGQSGVHVLHVTARPVGGALSSSSCTTEPVSNGRPRVLPEVRARGFEVSAVLFVARVVWGWGGWG